MQNLHWTLLASLLLVGCATTGTDDRASSYVDAGRRYLEEGMLEEALAAFEAALEQQPRDPTARRLRRITVHSLGLLPDAVVRAPGPVPLPPRTPRRSPPERDQLLADLLSNARLALVRGSLERAEFLVRLVLEARPGVNEAEDLLVEVALARATRAARP